MPSPIGNRVLDSGLIIINLVDLVGYLTFGRTLCGDSFNQATTTNGLKKKYTPHDGLVIECLPTKIKSSSFGK